MVEEIVTPIEIDVILKEQTDLEERQKAAKLILTRNFMDSTKGSPIKYYLDLGYPEWAIKKVLEERGEKLEIEDRVQIQVEAQLKNQVLTYLATKEKSKATELIVKNIKENNHIYTTRDDLQPEIWIYKEGIYVPQGRSFIKEYTRLILGEAFTNHICNEIISKIEADTYIDHDVFFNTNYKTEICVKNGILDIFTRKLSPFNPYKIFFSKCPVTYNSSSVCPNIDKFLTEILSNQDDKLVYYEIGGFILFKEYMFEKAVMLVGGGRNGKGKGLELYKRVVGSENCYSLPLSSLDSDNADVSQLFGKMVNLAGDIGHNDLKDTALFKSLTGRDLVTSKRKYLRALTFENYAKFIFACNELPMVYDLNKGFWDRWVMLEFPYYFADKEEYDRTKPEERLNWKIRDENIINKIATEDELSGLLNEFLNGLDRLMKNRKFSCTKGSEEIKSTWIRKSNSFVAFCMDCLEENYDSKISKKVLRKKYTDYCKKHKINSKSDFVIKRTIEDLFGASEERGENLGYREDNWVGIKWK